MIRTYLILQFLSIFSINLLGQSIIAEDLVLEKFDDHSIVAFGLSHWQQDLADYYLKLVQHPDFPKKVKNVVLESGNSLYQDILDRYINGEDVPYDQVKLVWQNTTQPGRGDDPQNRNLLEVIRRVNKNSNEKVRVLAGDPPIDWSKVKSASDILPFMHRDEHFASVVITQVLNRKQNALLIIGSGHVMNKAMSYEGLPPDTTRTVTNMIEEKFPNSVYVIIPHEDFGTRTKELEPKLSSYKTPALLDLDQSWVGDLDASLVYTGKILRIGMDPSHPAKAYPGLKLKDLADGYLFLGPISTIKRVQWQSERGTPYAKEIARRDSLVTKATMPNLPPPSSSMRIRQRN